MKKEKYNHLEIEKKWQKIWKEQKLFKVKVDPSKPKYYILDMFPYPSGAGLHVGHVTGYTATDILARYKRQKGFNVLHPMGWDSFGLQAEQYAVRTKTHPKMATEKNINTYRKQLQSLGFSYDWDREVTTSDPSYYKWTQWIFTKLYEKGLAYEAKVLVNYCPKLKTVLANEEVENGLSREEGFPVERRPLRQWVLKITAYAEQLLKDLDQLDWPEYLKNLQRNWIGKSQGVEIVFLENQTRQSIIVFTTRADTLFGVTFLVLSPEHPLVTKVTTKDQKEEVRTYLEKIASKSDLERTDLNKNKTGVWTGAYAINPVNDELIPIWIADYVLMNYGTGAVMGVPGGDQRDFDFAKKFSLPVIPIYDPNLKEHLDEVPRQVKEEDMRIEILSGHRAWTKGGILINSHSDHLDMNGLEMEKGKEKVICWLEEKKYGKRKVVYKLRDWLFSRQRYWGEPIPILHFEEGEKRLLELDELPLTLPEIADYRPTGEGCTPLDSATHWVDVIDSKTGKKGSRETNTMPQWAGSCWYYLRFCDPHNKEIAWDKDLEKYWMPVDLYVGGVEHAVLHLLYARFWHKVLYDLNLVSTKEPFLTLRNQGLVTAKSYKLEGGGYVSSDRVIQKEGQFYQMENGQEVFELVEKMSKSKFNGVSPDQMIEEFGADSLRLYEMFMGPFDKEKLWNSQAINGCRRFLDRFYQLVISDRVVEKEEFEAMKLAHRLVQGVEQDIKAMLFNTAISKIMEFVNAFIKLPKYPKKGLQMATQALYPFAPHLAEECWQILTHSQKSMTYELYPKASPLYFEEKQAIYIIQINGKLRGRLTLSRGKKEKELLEIIKKEEKFAKYLNRKVLKTIFIPNKLINIVLK